jgi:carboxylate-amine ligase
MHLGTSGRRRQGQGPDAPTVGVEEEFLLLDPRTGAVVPRAPEVIGACHAPGLVVAEVMSYMVETRTPVCRTLDDVHAALRQSRRLLARAAAHQGAVSVALGAAPFGLPPAPLVTDTPRYAELARRFPAAMRSAGTCACHVHVEVPNRQLGVQVLLRLRRWLPALLALTANSPVWEGRDSGWASHRIRLVSLWPTAMPLPAVSTTEEYDGVVHHVVTRGDALDVLGHEVHDRRLIGGSPSSAVWRR